MNHFILHPFWINEVACWSDLKSLNGPVGTENRGVAVFTHRDITQLIESTFISITCFRFQWSMAFVTSKFIKNINDAVNVSGGYFFFGSMLLLGTIFIIVYAPETKGKTNEQMKEMFLQQRKVSQAILNL